MTDGPIDAETFARLVEMTGGDFGFVDDLVDTYLDDGTKQLAALEAAVAGGDVDGLVRPAHSLKSSSLNVGAIGLGELSRQLEEAARSGSVPDAAERVATIGAVFAAVRDGLLDERRRRTQT